MRSKTVAASNVAVLFLNEIVRLCSLSSTIVSGRGVNFVSYFWMLLWKLFDSTLKYSSIFDMVK